MREPKFIVAVGAKGIGKTYTTKKIIEQEAEKRKVLIFDVNGEYTEYKSIPVDYIFEENEPNWIAVFASKKIKDGIRRILPVNKYGKNYTTSELNIILTRILDDFHGGILVIEDIVRYVGDNVKKDVIGNLATIRHKNCDVITHFQWKSKALNPKILGNTNLIRIHKTNDSFSTYKSKIKDLYEILYLAELIVNLKNKKLKEQNKPQRAFVYVDLDNNKILGKFSDEEIKEAISVYLSLEEKLLNYYLRLKNREGKNIYNYKTAYDEAEKYIINEYFK